MSSSALEPTPRANARFSLRALLLIGLVVTILVTMTLVSLSVLDLLRESVIREARRNAENTAAAFAPLDAELQHPPAHITLGNLDYGTDTLTPPHPRIPEKTARELAARVSSDSRTASTVLDDEHGHRVLAAAAGEEGRVTLVALPLDEQDRLVQNAQGLVLIFLLVVGIFVVLLGYFLLTRALVRPVRRLLAATERVARGDLDTPVRVGGAGEIADLSTRFNHMLRALSEQREQLELALDEQRRSSEALEHAQDRLVRSQRLASVGRLAAGVAHEIGNPLAAILAYLELCLDDDTTAEELREFLGHIENATQRIQHIIRELLDYSREAPIDIHPASPRGAVQQTLSLIAPQPRFRDVTIDNLLPTTLPTLPLDEHRLTQLLLNLCLNAADAMNGSGTLTLRTEQTEPATFQLHIEDTGPGIPPDALPHIFEPFFTTKDPGEGTGLGLAICERIASELDATLTAHNTDSGARFTLTWELGDT